MNKTVVVDLDGSLITINSFRFWLLFSFVFLFITFRWISLARFIKFVIDRLLGTSDRVMMKRGVLSITERLPKYFISWFVKFLNLFLNKNVLAKMSEYDANKYHIDLCTAAPICFAEVFAENLGFSHVFATPSVYISDWRENIGSEKLVSIESCYGDSVIIECVITDHYDDLPLLHRAKNRILVNPSTNTLEKIEGHFSYKII